MPLVSALTGAGSRFPFVFVGETVRGPQQAPWVEQTAAVLVRRWERVGGIRRYWVVGGGRLRAHGCQAASERAGALHLQPLR